MSEIWAKDFDQRMFAGGVLNGGLQSRITEEPSVATVSDGWSSKSTEMAESESVSFIPIIDCSPVCSVSFRESPSPS